jgi:hypothetical protein
METVEIENLPNDGLAQQSNGIDEMLALASRYYADGDFKQAEAVCQQILKVEPEQHVALHISGLVAHNESQIAQAIELISKAVEVAPEYAEAHLNLGVIFQGQRQLNDAVGCFKKALELDPSTSDGIKNLAVVLNQLGRDEEALKVLRDGLKRNPHDEDIVGYLSSVDDQVGIQFCKVRVENTNACRYKCDMCPREKMSRETGVMPPEDYRFFLGRMKEYIEETNIPDPYLGKFFLHGFGEPLLDQKLAEKSAMVAEQFPAAESHINTTLGVRRPHSYFNDLLAEGKLKRLLVSFYGFQEHTYSKIHESGSFRTAKENLIYVAELNASLGHPCNIWLQILSPHTQIVMKDDPAEKKAFEDLMAIIRPLGVKLNKLDLHNFGDGRAYYPADLDDSVCSVVDGRRRSHLNVTWDLKVVPCCFDYNSDIVLGDLRMQSIKQIYEGEKYQNFLDAHQSGELDAYPLCKGCDQR